MVFSKKYYNFHSLRFCINIWLSGTLPSYYGVIPTYIYYGDYVTIGNLALQSGTTYVVLYYSLEK